MTKTKPSEHSAAAQGSEKARNAEAGGEVGGLQELSGTINAGVSCVGVVEGVLLPFNGFGECETVRWLARCSPFLRYKHDV